MSSPVENQSNRLIPKIYQAWRVHVPWKFVGILWDLCKKNTYWNVFFRVILPLQLPFVILFDLVWVLILRLSHTWALNMSLSKLWEASIKVLLEGSESTSPHVYWVLAVCKIPCKVFVSIPLLKLHTSGKKQYLYYYSYRNSKRGSRNFCIGLADRKQLTMRTLPCSVFLFSIHPFHCTISSYAPEQFSWKIKSTFTWNHNLMLDCSNFFLVPKLYYRLIFLAMWNPLQVLHK